MWFRVNDHEFIGKKIQRDNGFSILVSDLKHIWQKFLSDDELLAISKKLNPLFDAPSPKLKEMTLDLFDDNDNVNKEITMDNNEIKLKLQSIKMNVKFVFDVNLQKGNEIMLYNEFTIPLLLTAIELQAREKKLIQMIKEKDIEINEYKQENSTFIKSLAETKPFNDEDFNNVIHSDYHLGQLKLNLVEFLSCLHSKIACLGKEFLNKSELMPPLNCDSNCNDELTKFSSISSKNSSQTPVQPTLNFNHQLIKRRKKHKSIV